MVKRSSVNPTHNLTGQYSTLNIGSAIIQVVLGWYVQQKYMYTNQDHSTTVSTLSCRYSQKPPAYFDDISLTKLRWIKYYIIAPHELLFQFMA